MKLALVTGHAGFIGRHITAALVKDGYYVRGVDLQPFDGGCGTDSIDMDAREYFREDDGSWVRYDIVVHAAAVVGGRAKIDGDPLALAVNLELDAALFQWAARTRPGRVVYLSSSAVYPVGLQRGAHEWPPPPLASSLTINFGADLINYIGTTCPECHGSDSAFPEGHREGCTWVKKMWTVPARTLREADAALDDPSWSPDQLYGWCKLTGERLAALARAEGIPVTICRPFSGYGEDQSEDYPFAAMAARARRRDDPFEIWGTGEQVRDWIHVDDICAAILAMVREGISGPMNLGTGRPVSMRELAGMFAAAAGYEPEFKTLPEKPSGVAYRVADVTRMSEFCTPAVSLEEGVARAIGRVRS